MGIKQNNIACIQTVIEKYDADIERVKHLIEFHKNKICSLLKEMADYETTKKEYQNHAPSKTVFKVNTPLTRNLIRTFMQCNICWLRTVDLISLLYQNQPEEEIRKLIKTLSVILNQMTERDEIEIKKESGIKGNLYRWKIQPTP